MSYLPLLWCIVSELRGINMRANTVQDFWNRVNKTDTCWLWLSEKNKKGYGRFYMRRKFFFAHRLSYVLEHGDIKDYQVLHRCNIPSCVNPRHLFLGTNQDNVDDKMEKGRHWNQGKKLCKSGHEFNDKNTSIRPNGNRRCKKCSVLATQKWQKKNYDSYRKSRRKNNRNRL